MATTQAPTTLPSQGIAETETKKWFATALRILPGMLSTGVITLPYAISELGWRAGIAVLSFFWTVVLVTLLQIVEMQESHFSSYQEFVQHQFGEKFHLYIVVGTKIFISIAYMIIGGISAMLLHHSFWPDCNENKPTYFILFVAFAQAVVSLLDPNPSAIDAVAVAMPLMYSCIIIWVALQKLGEVPGVVEYGYRSATTAGQAFDFINALGVIAFVFAGHNSVLKIQSEKASRVKNGFKRPLFAAVVFSYMIVASFYLLVALVGYSAYGVGVDLNVLVTLSSSDRPRSLIAIANFMVVVHVIVSYHRAALPVFEIFEKLGITGRMAFIVAETCIAVAFPVLRWLLGFFGGFVFAPTIYIFPSMMWIALKKPNRFSFYWFFNLFLIFTGVMLMVLASISGLEKTIKLHT